MFEVVYNACYGGFSLSEKALDWLKESGIDLGDNCYPLENELPRHHPLLVKCVKELGKEAGNKYAHLVIVEVSGKYRIQEYDGYESVETPDLIKWTDPNEI